MKPIDSIQLAIAINTGLSNLVFVSADQRLNEIVKNEGILFLNPEAC